MGSERTTGPMSDKDQSSTARRIAGGVLFKRALRLRCPVCGGPRMFRGWTRMHPRCRACGLVFQREGGYWLGAMYVNYGVAVALFVIAHLVLTDIYAVRSVVQAVILVPAVILFVIWFFRYSRALWLALDLTCDPADDDDFAASDDEVRFSEHKAQQAGE